MENDKSNKNGQNLINIEEINENDKSKNEGLVNDFQEKFEMRRFGHTFNLLNSNQAILFGGAISSIKNLTNDTFVYFIKEKGWIKISPTGIIPSARAAHASICKDEVILFTFGGALKNAHLADNDIHYLEFSKGITKGEWRMIKLKDTKPQRRYGHTLVYSKPFLILFGGTSEENKYLNDIWIINIDDLEKETLEWNEVQTKDKVPSPRTYFSTCICKGGKAKGMILIFGGRGEKKELFNDFWGLRKHRNGNWEWVSIFLT